jgi:maltokinase
VSESADLVSAVISGRDVPGLRVFAPIAPGPLRERPITVDQTNRSVVVGERVIVKWMRTLKADRSPRLLAHLAEAGFTRMPTPHAALFRGGDLVALITEFLPEALDGWDWGVDALLEGGPAADFGAAVGTLAAELHAALATPTSVIPSPVRVMAGADDWKTAVDEAVTAADDDWVRSIAPCLAADLTSPARERPGPALVLHGDLHIGQILKWSGGYAVTDFDGHPTAADRPEPLARDVAQLRTSILHVAEIANKRTEGRRTDELRQWGRDTADALLTAYRKELEKRSFSPLFDPDLLRPFEVEQECRELVYAARFLPRWQYAPMGVLKAWYAE